MVTMRRAQQGSTASSRSFCACLMKAQSSLEALASLAFLLAALALLLHAAWGAGDSLSASSQALSERYLLSYEALSIDTAASSFGFSQTRAFHGVPSENAHSLVSRSSNASQPLFHAISFDSQGNFYVQNCCEPI